MDTKIREMVSGYTEIADIEEINLSIYSNGKLTYYSNQPNQPKNWYQNKIALDRLSEILTSIICYQISNANPELLDLNKPLSRYLKNVEIIEPQFNMRFATPQVLLSHTSGIGEYRQLWDRYLFNGGYMVSSKIKNSLRKFYENSPIEQHFTPNHQWYPTRHNYGLIGLLLEEVTKIEFPDLLHNHIVEPLQLQQTDCSDDDGVRRIITSAEGIFSSYQDFMVLISKLILGFHGEDDGIPGEVCQALFKTRYELNEKLNKIASPLVILGDYPNFYEYTSADKDNVKKILINPKNRFAVLIHVKSVNKITESLTVDKLTLRIMKELKIYNKPQEILANPINTNYPQFMIFQASKEFIKLKYYSESFGNAIYIENTKKGIIIKNPMNLIREYKFNKKLRPKMIKPIFSDTKGIYYGFHVGGVLRRLFIPNSSNPLSIIIETPGPVYLRRVSKKRTGSISRKIVRNYWIERIFIFYLYYRLKSVVRGFISGLSLITGLIKQQFGKLIKAFSRFIHKMSYQMTNLRVTSIRTKWFNLGDLFEERYYNLYDWYGITKNEIKLKSETMKDRSAKHGAEMKNGIAIVMNRISFGIKITKARSIKSVPSVFDPILRKLKNWNIKFEKRRELVNNRKKK